MSLVSGKGRLVSLVEEVGNVFWILRFSDMSLLPLMPVGVLVTFIDIRCYGLFSRIKYQSPSDLCAGASELALFCGFPMKFDEAQ